MNIEEDTTHVDDNPFKAVATGVLARRVELLSSYAKLNGTKYNARRRIYNARCTR